MIILKYMGGHSYIIGKQCKSGHVTCLLYSDVFKNLFQKHTVFLVAFLVYNYFKILFILSQPVVSIQLEFVFFLPRSEC